MQDVYFTLIGKSYTKDSTGQMVPSANPTEANVIGFQKSASQNEYFQAEQAGIRAEGVIEMNIADYSGEDTLSINGKPYTIYRTYEPGPDKIELHYGEMVGNG